MIVEDTQAAETITRKDRTGLAYGVGAAAILGVFIPIYAVPGFSLTSANVFYAYLLVVWSAIRLGILLMRGAPRLLDIAAWVFMYSFLTLPWLAQVTQHQYPLGTGYSYDDGSISKTTLIIVLGIVAYEVGRLSLLRRKAPLVADESTAAQLPNISIRAALIVAYVGFAFVALAVARNGIATFFTSRDALTQALVGPAPIGVKFYLQTDKAAGSSLLLISQVPIFVGTYLLLYVRQARIRLDGVRILSGWVLAPLIIANIVINNPISNPRSWYGTVLIGFLSIYLPLRQRRGATRLFIIVFIFVTLFSFHQLAAFRRTNQRDFSAEPIQTSLVSDPDYGSPQQIMNAVQYLQTNTHKLGGQLAGAVFVFVPRKLWAGKPGDTGQLIGGAAGFKVAGPIWTDGLVDFGLVGVVLYLATVGLLVGILDRRYLYSARAPNLLAAFAPMMSSLLSFVLRGSLQPALATVYPVVACVLVCYAPHKLVPVASNLLVRRPARGRLSRLS